MPLTPNQDQLNLLKTEIQKYLGLPYLINRPKSKIFNDITQVGKASAHQLALKTIEIANQQIVKILDLNPKEIYNFQKKNHLGIDCSGLACQLLNYYAEIMGIKFHLPPRTTSADTLTSPPLSSPIDVKNLTTADLIRQKNGNHVVFIIEAKLPHLYCVESSRLGRGVRLIKFVTDNPPPSTNGYFRLNRFF